MKCPKETKQNLKVIFKVENRKTKVGATGYIGLLSRSAQHTDQSHLPPIVRVPHLPRLNGLLHFHTKRQASYPLTFSPLRVCEDEITSKLVLTDTKDSIGTVTFEFNLRGTAEEPLAEKHRVVRCSARERMEESFTLKNTTTKGKERGGGGEAHASNTSFDTSFEVGRKRRVALILLQE